MDYATVDDVLARVTTAELAQVTDQADGQTVDRTRIETKLGDAFALIDGRVGRVYQLPLAGCTKPGFGQVPPPQLTQIAVDLVRFWLRDAVSDDSDVRRRFKDAVAQLDAIADGSALLACPWGGSAGTLVGSDAQQGQEVLYSFSPRQVTDDSLHGYR